MVDDNKKASDVVEVAVIPPLSIDLKILEEAKRKTVEYFNNSNNYYGVCFYKNNGVDASKFHFYACHNFIKYENSKEFIILELCNSNFSEEELKELFDIYNKILLYLNTKISLTYITKVNNYDTCYSYLYKINNDQIGGKDYKLLLTLLNFNRYLTIREWCIIRLAFKYFYTYLQKYKHLSEEDPWLYLTTCNLEFSKDYLKNASDNNGHCNHIDGVNSKCLPLTLEELKQVYKSNSEYFTIKKFLTKIKNENNEKV